MFNEQIMNKMIILAGFVTASLGIAIFSTWRSSLAEMIA